MKLHVHGDVASKSRQPSLGTSHGGGQMAPAISKLLSSSHSTNSDPHGQHNCVCMKGAVHEQGHSRTLGQSCFESALGV